MHEVASIRFCDANAKHASINPIRFRSQPKAPPCGLKGTVPWVNQRQKLIPCLFIAKGAEHR